MIAEPAALNVILRCELLRASKDDGVGPARTLRGSPLARLAPQDDAPPSYALRCPPHPAPNSSASTKISRVRFTSGQQRSNSAPSAFKASPLMARSSAA